MKKKKYLYLLLLLILPIIFFGVSKISLNSSKIETKGEILNQEDTLAATSYTYYSCKRCVNYKITKTGNYISKTPYSAGMKIPNNPTCGSIQTKTATKCNFFPTSNYDRNLYVYNATSKCNEKENYNSRSNIQGGECTQKTVTGCSSIPVELCKLYSSCVQGTSSCQDPKPFNVTFFGQGGTFYGSGSSTRVEKCNSTSCAITMPTPTRSGYKFLGYCKGSTSCPSSKYVQPERGKEHSEATVYYAQWEQATTKSTTKST
ncbi:MAG: hypothetical protein Q4C33_02710, partial [bacterium]|nr:hypothetical protein [bacterium]